MVPAALRSPRDGTETLYLFITDLAARAPDRKLLATLVASLTGVILVWVLIPSLWPLASLGGTVATISSWGLLEHHDAARHPRLLLAAQHVLAVAGTLLAIAGGFGLFFASLGPRWVL